MDSKHLRNGLCAIGVLGIGVTSWISVQCSRKADKETDKKKKARCYIPAVVSGVITAGCMITSNRMGNAEIAALAAGAAYMARNRDKIKLNPTAVADPKDAKQKSLPSSRPMEIAPWEGPSIEWTGKGTLLCFEAYSGRLFYSSREAVEKAEEELNARFVQGEYLPLNTFYELLGIEKTSFGEDFGWAANSDYYSGPIEFINTDDTDKHGQKMLIIDIYTRPMECWPQV